MKGASPVEAAISPAPGRGAVSNAPVTGSTGHFSDLLTGRSAAPSSTAASKAPADGAASTGRTPAAPAAAKPAAAPASTTAGGSATASATAPKTAAAQPAATPANAAQSTSPAVATAATSMPAQTTLVGATLSPAAAATSVLAAGTAKSSKSAGTAIQKGAGKRSALSTTADSSAAALAAATPIVSPSAPPLDNLADIEPAEMDDSGLDLAAVATPGMAAGGHESDGTVANVDDATAGTSFASSRTLALAAPSLLTMPSGSAQSNDARAAGNTAALNSASTTASSSPTHLTALSDLVRALPTSEASSSDVERSIELPVSDPNWSHALAAQVQVLTAGNIQSATLRLSPEHLGPVEVHIEVQSAQVNVSFSAAHAETRSALEQSVPALRAMFAHSGLTLGQSSVQGETRPGSQSFKTRSQGLAAADSEPAPQAATAPRAIGLIDEYA